MITQSAIQFEALPQTIPLEHHGFRNSATDISSAFPENRFPPGIQDEPAYRRLVSQGYETMRRRRVVFAGVARDVAGVLPLTISRLERLGSYFSDYRVVIYENDSRDGTRETLQQWSRRNRRVVLLSDTRHDPLNLPVRCPHRGDRMAWYRNQYAHYIQSHYREFDEVIVADTDLASGWSYDGVANTYGHKDWDSVGSYGIIYRRIGWLPNHIFQYDAWAYRKDEQFTALSTKEVNHMRWQRGAPLVPVTSCFGGLAVYRMPAFLSGQYGGGDCEHIALHRSMRHAGFRRMFLNPNQITLYGRKNRKMDRCVVFCQQLLASTRLVAAPLWL